MKPHDSRETCATESLFHVKHSGLLVLLDAHQRRLHEHFLNQELSYAKL